MQATLDPLMAKKSRRPPEPEPVPVPEPVGRKPMVVQLRGSEAWKKWAEGLADREGDTVSKLVERALRKWAKETGYPDPPRR
jgi:hypothetical protein